MIYSYVRNKTPLQRLSALYAQNNCYRLSVLPESLASSNEIMQSCNDTE